MRATPLACARRCSHRKAMVDKLTPLFDRAYRTYVKAEQSRLDNTDYNGPQIIPLLGKAQKATQSSAREAQRLGTTIRKSCKG
jgi:hypothetical protein